MKKRRLLAIAMVASVAMMSVFFTACSSSPASGSNSSQLSGQITASGSSALEPLVAQASKDFKQKNSDVSITVNAGGSGTGLNQVANGSVDIGNSDVAADTKLSPELAKTLVDHTPCLVGVAIVVSSDVSVKNLTTDQLIQIFTGKVTNWNQVGGANQKITLVTRPSSSSTRALFEKYALKGQEESSSSLSTDDSGALKQYIQQNKGAIGYLSLSYLVGSTGVNSVSLDGVAPTLDNIYKGKYNVWGTEHMYTKGKPTGATAAFLNYIMKNYNSQMESMGYGVTSKMQTSAVHCVGNRTYVYKRKANRGYRSLFELHYEKL